MHYADTTQMEFIHPKMRVLLDDIELMFGKQIITSQFRIDDPGVHGTLPLRGIDLRARHVPEARKKVRWINKYWKYDPKRSKLKVAQAHGEGDNYHIHLQVNNNTEEKNGSQKRDI